MVTCLAHPPKPLSAIIPFPIGYEVIGLQLVRGLNFFEAQTTTMTVEIEKETKPEYPSNGGWLIFCFVGILTR